MKENGAHCTVPIASVDSLIPSKLTSTLQDNFKDASSAFIKIDTEGMDELVIRGMSSLLQEQRGTYEDGSPRYLVNFFQFEYSPLLMSLAKEREGFHEYDLKTVAAFLESIGFESFLIGPRYLPLSMGHGTMTLGHSQRILETMMERRTHTQTLPVSVEIGVERLRGRPSQPISLSSAPPIRRPQKSRLHSVPARKVRTSTSRIRSIPSATRRHI